MEKAGNARNRFWKYLRSLIEPPPTMADIQQRHQSRLLSAVLLIMIGLGGVSGIVELLTIANFYLHMLSYWLR
jgi:hypothetical protein